MVRGTSFGDAESEIQYDSADIATETDVIRAIDGDDLWILGLLPLLDKHDVFPSKVHFPKSTHRESENLSPVPNYLVLPQSHYNIALLPGGFWESSTDLWSRKSPLDWRLGNKARVETKLGLGVCGESGF